MNPPSSFSTLALVPIAVAAATPLITAVFIYAFVLNYDSIGRPFLDFLTKRGGGWLGGLIRWTTRPLTKRIEAFVAEHVAALRRLYFVNQRMLAVALDSTAEVVNRVAGTIGEMSEQIYEALWTLNHETIPRKIAVALVPIRNVLANHTGRLDDLEDLNRRVAVAVGDTLRALPWGVPGGYVTNIETFLGRFAQLWEHYWNTTREQLNTLLGDTIPEIRRDIADLARRLDVQIDARFDALGGRITDLERWRENVVMPRLDALTEGLDALADQIFDPVAGGLTALLERVGEIERQLREDIAERFAALEAGLAELRLDLEEGIRTGLEVFRERIEALENAVNIEIPAQLDAMRLAIDTLAAEVFTEVGAGLTALTARITAIEDTIGTIILPQVELVRTALAELQAQITGDIIPRIRAIEDILAPAAFGAFVLAALKVSAPYLFCENVIRGAKEVCAAPADVIDNLLLAALAIVGGISIIELAREMQAITGLTAGAIDEWIVED